MSRAPTVDSAASGTAARHLAAADGPAVEVTRAFVALLAGDDGAGGDGGGGGGGDPFAALCEDATLRAWGRDGCEVIRARDQVAAWFEAQRAGWRAPRVSALTTCGAGERVALELEIQVLNGGRAMAHAWAAFLAVDGGKIAAIDLYRCAAVPRKREDDWVAPPTLPADEVVRLALSGYQGDLRLAVPARWRGFRGAAIETGGMGDPHPYNNVVRAACWPADEADAQIAALIEDHRGRDVGFCWYVSPIDSPADLGARLLRHGMVRAGGSTILCRRGLGPAAIADIPTNPDISIDVIGLDDEAAIAASLDVVGEAFGWGPERVEPLRVYWYDRARDPELHETQIQYLARLDGEPVAYARMSLEAGIATLDGAATLPAYRRRRLYSTLLARRLRDAHARGYCVAVIDAQPSSRPVVERHGFEPCGSIDVYAWMPVIDMDVIEGLIQRQ